MDLVFNDEPARQARKCFKKVEILREGDATVLDILYLNAVITATVEIPKGNGLRKDMDGTGKSDVENFDFF